jgi:hypothetical protein
MNMNPCRIIPASLLPTLVVAVAVAAESPRSQRSATITQPPRRSLSAIQVDVHAALRSEAVTRRLGENTADVIRLIELYREMAAHPQRDKSILLRKLALQLRARLEKVRDYIGRHGSLSQRRANAKKSSPPVLAVPEPRVLAQQIGGPGGPPAGQPAPPAAAPVNDAGTIDYGPELVDLIQQTISPATWDINGGNGAVAYFAPRHAIVVSAPQRVHDKIDDVLGQLRAAP